jgi:type II secretory pathway component GspD/PulD (secretin)
MTILLGGVISERKQERENKVPILGDVPVLNFFFKSRETQNIKTNLIFAITPTIYDPNSSQELVMANDAIRALPVKNTQLMDQMREGMKDEEVRPVKTTPYIDIKKRR